MPKDISFITAKNTVKKHGLKCISICEYPPYNKMEWPLDSVLKKVKKEVRKLEDGYYPYVLLLGAPGGKFLFANSFVHADPVFLEIKNGKLEKIIGLTNFEERIIFTGEQRRSDKYICPKSTYEGFSASVFGNGMGCLELAIYSLKGFDPQRGIILNGQKGHGISELKRKNAYTTQEICKLTRSEKYLKANGIDSNQLEVTNSEGKKMSLAAYRSIYTLGSNHNHLLNVLSDAKKRVPVKRENSLEDLRQLSQISDSENQKTVEQLIQKREAINTIPKKHSIGSNASIRF